MGDLHRCHAVKFGSCSTSYRLLLLCNVISLHTLSVSITKKNITRSNDQSQDRDQETKTPGLLMTKQHSKLMWIKNINLEEKT